MSDMMHLHIHRSLSETVTPQYVSSLCADGKLPEVSGLQ